MSILLPLMDININDEIIENALTPPCLKIQQLQYFEFWKRNVKEVCEILTNLDLVSTYYV